MIVGVVRGISQQRNGEGRDGANAWVAWECGWAGAKHDDVQDEGAAQAC